MTPELPKAERILLAAAAVFARVGFAAARMDDVAREAGVSKGAVYLYYSSKDELIDALIGWLIGMEAQRLAAARAADESVERRLVEFVHGYAGDAVQALPLGPVFLEAYARASRQETARQALTRGFDAFTGELAGLVEEGVESGEFKQVDSGAVAMEIAALVEGLAVFAFVNPDRLDLVAAADHGIRTVLDGLQANGNDTEGAR